MGMQLSDCVENIVEKGEIAPYEQFLLFPQCFQKQSVVNMLKEVYILAQWKKRYQILEKRHISWRGIT